MQSILLGLLLVGLVSAQQNSGTPKAASGTPPTTNCACGRGVQTRIIGGSEAPQNQYPFVAALTLAKKRPFCGAVIITKIHAITAAQCTSETKANITEMRLLVGAHNYKEAVDSQFIPVNSTIEHYLFKPNGNYDHDVAVVVLQKALVFNSIIAPACVVPRWMDMDNLNIVVAGWGITRKNGPLSLVLKRTLIKVISSETCYRFYPGELHKFKSQFCTYQKDVDTCQGDAGGPVFGYDASISRYVVVGLISFGRACASENPSVNINLGYYIGWVKGVVNKTKLTDEEVCYKI